MLRTAIIYTIYTNLYYVWLAIVARASVNFVGSFNIQTTQALQFLSD